MKYNGLIRDNMEAKFQSIKKEILRLSEILGLEPKPIVKLFQPGDSCDTTDPPHIRIKPNDVDVEYHARHVLGHYVSDVHLLNADHAADIIADLLVNR